MNKIGFITTRSSSQNYAACLEHENVSYISYKKSAKKICSRDHLSKTPTNSDKDKAFEMKKLRYDVIKFGSSGMDANNKETSEIALAVALGAKMPKNKYVNYKKILTDKQKTEGSANKFARPSPFTAPKPQNRHLYVVGDKIIPAKHKSKADFNKSFLGKYGNVTKQFRQKGGAKKRHE